MIIKQIIWLSEEIQEAEILITDGNFTCTVFAHPLRLKTNDKIEEPLHIYNVKNIVKSDDCCLSIGFYRKNNDDFSYKIIALVAENNILKVGEFDLILDDDISDWINVGDCIEVECSRIDLW